MGYGGVKLLKRDSFFRRRPKHCRPRQRQQCMRGHGRDNVGRAFARVRHLLPSWAGTGFGRSCELTCPSRGDMFRNGQRMWLRSTRSRTTPLPPRQAPSSPSSYMPSWGIISPYTGLMQFQTDHELSATAQFCSAWNQLMGGAGGLIVRMDRA